MSPDRNTEPTGWWAPEKLCNVTFREKDFIETERGGWRGGRGLGGRGGRSLWESGKRKNKWWRRRERIKNQINSLNSAGGRNTTTDRKQCVNVVKGSEWSEPLSCHRLRGSEWSEPLSCHRLRGSEWSEPVSWASDSSVYFHHSSDWQIISALMVLSSSQSLCSPNSPELTEWHYVECITPPRPRVS